MHVRYSIRSAVTWRIVTELIRRHHQRFSLRVYELHPGGGQYDCLAILGGEGGDSFAKQIAHFNIQSQHLHVFHPLDTESSNPQRVGLPDNDYVLAFLQADDPREVVDRIERALGMPQVQAPLPPSTPAVLGLRVIAGLLERFALSRLQLEARCAWHDSSGMEGSYPVMSWLAPFPSLRDKVKAHNQALDWVHLARVAGRVWRVGPVGMNEQGFAIDLGTAEACALGNVSDRTSLWKIYQQRGYQVGLVVDWLETRLHSL